MDTTPTPSATCTACRSTIPQWEPPRYVCTGCQQTASGHLAALPALYAQLDPTLRRGSALVGARTAACSRPPLNLHIVDLAGPDGALPVLTGWMQDWHESGAGALPAHWPTLAAERMEIACDWLRWRLDWACRTHPAADDMVREIAAAHRQVHAAATGDRERAIRLACPCGGHVTWRASTDHPRCSGCGTVYSRTAATALPITRTA